MFESILIICSGNICRSPIAEALLRDQLQGTPRRVASAGITALVGHPADPFAVEVCREEGLDISGHRGQQATIALLVEYDLILTLAQVHNDWINRYHPQLRGRTHKLNRWRDNSDIDDPFRGPIEEFRRAFVEIRDAVGDWLPKLRP